MKYVYIDLNIKFTAVVSFVTSKV